MASDPQYDDPNRTPNWQKLAILAQGVAAAIFIWQSLPDTPTSKLLKLLIQSDESRLFSSEPPIDVNGVP